MRTDPVLPSDPDQLRPPAAGGWMWQTDCFAVEGRTETTAAAVES